VTSRGVALWTSDRPDPCGSRVFVATLDARLIAVDAANGSRCRDFGQNGEVALASRPKAGLLSSSDDFSVTSPPTVIGNVVIVGSSVGDNFSVQMASGMVRAFDAVSGKPLWQWEPIPWAQKQRIRTGAANAWSVISADPKLGLVYVPTGSASPDYFGGLRPGRNDDADSVVALEAASGKKVWSFQLVHHDLWDYDTAAQPLLFTFHGDIPAVAATNKTGMVYVLDRRTGAPIYDRPRSGTCRRAVQHNGCRHSAHALPPFLRAPGIKRVMLAPARRIERSVAGGSFLISPYQPWSSSRNSASARMRAVVSDCSARPALASAVHRLRTASVGSISRSIRCSITVINSSHTSCEVWK
jgi:glucose dehydrogenase